MMSAWWLLLIVPVSAMFGFIIAVLCAAADEDDALDAYYQARSDK